MWDGIRAGDTAAVKGNTTFVASLSNFGAGGKELASGKYQPLLAFLDTLLNGFNLADELSPLRLFF